MIIITDAQYRSCVSMIEALAQSGEDIILCAEEGTNPPAFHSKYCVMARFMPKDTEEYRKELAELCKFVCTPESEEKPVIIPIGLKTVRLLAEYKDEFSEYADFIVPDKDVLETANDKEKMSEAAEESGIRIPRMIPVNESGDPLTNRIRYPVYVKPVFGEAYGMGASERYDIAFDEEEIANSYAKYLELTGKAPIVQEYAGDIGIGVCVVMDKNSEPVNIFCHKRVREYPVSGGPSSCCVSMFSQNLVNGAVKLLKAIGYTGIAMVEFRGSDDGHFAFLEVNTRIWGSFPLCVNSGSSFISDYVLAARGASFSVPDTHYKRGKMMSFAVNDILSGVDYIKSGSTALGLHAFGSIVDPTVSDGIFDLDDPKPFFVYLDNCRKKIAEHYKEEKN